MGLHKLLYLIELSLLYIAPMLRGFFCVCDRVVAYRALRSRVPFPGRSFAITASSAVQLFRVQVKLELRAATQPRSPYKQLPQSKPPEW